MKNIRKVEFSFKPTNLVELKPNHSFIIDDTVILSDEEFLRFTDNILDDYEFIQERINLMYRDQDNIWHVILVTSSASDFGLLVESEGYSYARYCAYILKEDIK